MSSINSSGFKYRLDSLDITSESLLVAYDFVSGSNFQQGFLTTPNWVTGSTFSGKINGTYPNFYTSPGSGFFNGLTSVSISGKIPEDDFTFLFCYEKQRSGEEILLSSAAGNSFAAASGLTVGINDANKLYLEYWSPVVGKKTLDYADNISSKNLVFFSKTFDEFQLGVFDPVGGDLSFSSTSVDQIESYSHSDSFLIGSAASSSYWSKGRSFSGHFDDFYCISGKKPNDYFIELFSGFYSIPITGLVSGQYQVCDFVSVLSGSGVNLGTGITGYETVVTYTTGYVPTGCFNSGYSYFVGTGITGYEERLIGTQRDACDQNVPIYVRTALTGNIYATGYTYACSGSGQVITPTYTNYPLTGMLTGQVFVEVLSGICSDFTGYFPDTLQIDSGFVASLGFDSIYLFNQCANIATSECFLYTGNFAPDNINLTPSFDSVINDWAVPSIHSGSGKNLFFNNGQLMLESGWSSYQESGITKYNITGNIFLDGNIVRSNGYCGSQDTMIYDNSNFISGMSIYLLTGLGSSANFNSVLNSSYQDFSIFLNGIKMTSGFDYFNSNFAFNIPPSSVLTKINNNYISNNARYITGSGNLLRLGTNGLTSFFKKSSQVYLNGLRQLINNDYAEISRFSILTGCPAKEVVDNQLVYSFDEEFWNI